MSTEKANDESPAKNGVPTNEENPLRLSSEKLPPISPSPRVDSKVVEILHEDVDGSNESIH